MTAPLPNPAPPDPAPPGSALGKPRARRPLPPLWLLLPATLVALGVLVPLGYLLYEAAQADLSSLGELVWRQRNLDLLLSTLLLTAGVVAGATALGLPLAYLTARTDFRPRRLLGVVGALPLAVPGYVGAYSLIAATGPGGSLDALVGWAPPAPHGYFGAWLVLTVFTFPYLYLNLLAGLRSADPAPEEAARLLGRSRLAVFREVTLPALRPAWWAGAMLVTLHVLGDFAVVSLMRYSTFSAAIYQQYTAAYDTVYAAWLVLALLLLTGAALWLEARVLRGLFLTRVSGGVARPFAPVRLGHWRWAAFALALVVLLLGTVLPLGTSLYWLRLEAGESLAATFAGAVAGAAQSGLSALLTVCFAVPLAFALAYIGSRYAGPLARLTERTAFLGYAVPPVALALALVLFVLGVFPAAYQTLGLLVAAYTLHFTAEAIGPLRSALVRAASRLEDAARLLGRRRSAALREVTLPIAAPGLLVSAAFVFLSVLKELPLTLLLAPAGFGSLALGVWTYTEEALYGQAAPYALALMLLGAVLALLIMRRERA